MLTSGWSGHNILQTILNHYDGRCYLDNDRQSEWAARARRSLKFCEMQVPFDDCSGRLPDVNSAAKAPVVVKFFETPAGYKMKLSAAAIMLLCSVATSFAGNFTPNPKNKVVQNVCSTNCQNAFELCVRLRGTGTPPPTVGTQQVAPQTAPLVVGSNCEFERDTCQRHCVLNPRG
jgi:hypothetical protein